MKGDRRARDAAVLLPIGALLIFMPPYLRLLDQPGTIFGIPLLYAYLFTLWLVGIVLTGLLARRLVRSEPADGEHGGPEPPGRSG